MRHRSLFDPAQGVLEESRITAACELALLVWLWLRDEQPRLSHRTLQHTFLDAALSCVHRWKQSSEVQAILASGPVAAWSGELALTVPTRPPAMEIAAKTAAQLARVTPDRQLEWCWWCMQIDPSAHWQQRIRQLVPQLLVRTLADAAPLATREAYRLTHLIFYGTDFGRAALLHDSDALAGLRDTLHSAIQHHAHNHDLIAEVLVALRCLGWQDTEDARQAFEHLRQAQLPHGGFVDADDLRAYHTCLVLLLPVVCPDGVCGASCSGSADACLSHS